MSIRILLKSSALLSLLVLIGCGSRANPVPPTQQSTAQSKPNVLVVTIDTCRADRIGSYGYGLARTPTIDALATEGVLCTDAITTAPITMPAHSSILTGLYPPAHGVRDNGAYALSDEAVTLAERLKLAGYDTHAIVSAMVLSRRYNLTQGFDAYDDDLYAEDQPPMFMIPDRPAQRTGQRAVDWLTEREASGPDSPFFMWVHFFDPHHPHQARVPDQHLIPTPYDAEIAQADDGLEKLIGWLEANDQLDNTLVVLTADHGESHGEHGEKTHAIFVYDATVRVPLILRYPALLPTGKTYEGPVRTVDIVPTVLAALDLPGGEDTQGMNLLPAFRGEIAPPSLPQYSESLLSELGFGMAPLYAVRLDGYKYIRAPRPELYDLKVDPKELTNLYAEKPEIARRLDTELQNILDRSSARAFEAKENPMDQETLEMLHALGYLTAPEERDAMGGMDPKDGIIIHEKLERGRNLARQGLWENAETSLREILAEIPGHVAARNVLALTLVRQEKESEAEVEYLESLATEPHQNRVLALLGVLKLKQGELDDAEAFLMRCLELTPKFSDAMIHMAFLEAARGNRETSQTWIAKAKAVDPKSPRVEVGMARLYFREDEYEKALTHYNNALALLPGHYFAQVRAGLCLLRLGRPAESRPFFEAASALRPDEWVPPYNLACASALQGQKQAAFGHLAAALSKEPNPRQFLAIFENDSDLESLRSIEGYAEILGALQREARIAATGGTATP